MSQDETASKPVVGSSSGHGQQRTHGWVRTYAVPDDLVELHGPAGGVLRLPLSVYSSGRGPGREFDLADPAQQAELYEIVLTSGTVADQARYLHPGRLRALWPGLWLPAALREAWEPLLAEQAGAGAVRQARPAEPSAAAQQPPAGPSPAGTPR